MWPRAMLGTRHVVTESDVDARRVVTESDVRRVASRPRVRLDGERCRGAARLGRERGWRCHHPPMAPPPSPRPSRPSRPRSPRFTSTRLPQLLHRDRVAPHLRRCRRFAAVSAWQYAPLRRRRCDVER